LEKTLEQRKKKWEEAKRPFFESICYRKGKSNSWEEELSDETKKLFKIYYPELK